MHLHVEGSKSAGMEPDNSAALHVSTQVPASLCQGIVESVDRGEAVLGKEMQMHS